MSFNTASPLRYLSEGAFTASPLRYPALQCTASQASVTHYSWRKTRFTLALVNCRFRHETSNVSEDSTLCTASEQYDVFVAKDAIFLLIVIVTVITITCATNNGCGVDSLFLVVICQSSLDSLFSKYRAVYLCRRQTFQSLNNCRVC